MQETEIYEQNLGLKQPWFVTDVKLDAQAYVNL